jgi:hypothetical protein
MIYFLHSKHIIDLDTWPTKQTFDACFSLQLIEARKRHIMVGFMLRTISKFRDIKALIRPILDRNAAWIYQHTLAFNRLDIVPLGYRTHTNPHFHSTACLSDEVRSLLLAQYTQLSGAVREKSEDEFCVYFDDDNNIDPPQLLITPVNVHSGDEHSRAFEIQVERAHLPALKCF